MVLCRDLSGAALLGSAALTVPRAEQTFAQTILCHLNVVA